MVHTIARPSAEESLTPDQHAQYMRFAWIGEELRALYHQNTEFVNNIGDFKSVPRKRKKGYFICHPDSNKIYKAVYRLEWANWRLLNSAGFAVWNDLENALYLLDERTGVHSLVINGEEEDSDRLICRSRCLSNEEISSVSLDSQPNMTEGDLALLIAFAKRYKEWVEAIKPLVHAKHARRFWKDIDGLEQQATKQFQAIFDSS